MILASIFWLLLAPALTVFQPTDLRECPPESKDMTNLWRVNTEPPSYFYGTIHVPFTQLWDGISDNSKAAFSSSDKLLVELDLSDPETVQGLTNCRLLPDNKSLTEMLPEDMLQRLKDHLAWVSRNMSSWLSKQQKKLGLTFSSISANWERKRPFFIRKQVNDYNIE